jgi:Transglutaminase-like superfamily
LIRRDLLAAGLAIPIVAWPRHSATAATERTVASDEFLRPTNYIDSRHPAIVNTADQVTRAITEPRQKAIALFEFVRAIPFGFATGFWDMRASDVLRTGRGYCNTKSTLLIALLRATAIPARQHFVEIDAAVLHGILDPGTAMVDHSYVEVLLNGRWVATDAYIVDPPLFMAAQRRLTAERRLLGYSAHSTGSKDWDAMSPSFSQYNLLDDRPIGVKRWGIYADVGDFYAQVRDAHNRLNPVLRAGFGLLVGSANRRAEALRNNIA